MDKMKPGVIDKALQNHMAILGKTGSGKSNAAKWMAEELMARGERVCSIDPTGTWWGLRLTRKGKASSFKPVIFGGSHADVPIAPEHGAAIAELVSTMAESTIIDLRQMTVGGRTRFFTAFAETLLQKNVGSLHLMLDEAHLFAPQGRVNDPQSGAMLHATNNLVSLGRGNGIKIAMISQRPAKLHKDSLTQVETMVAMRLIAPQDRAAINEWVGEWGDDGKGKTVVPSLPTLRVGEAWFWAPEQDYLERIKFPLVSTLDTGRQDPVTQGMAVLKFDIDAVTAKLESIAVEVVENDPRRLKARVAELERELRDRKGNPEDLEARYTAGWDSGYAAGAAERGKELGKLVMTFASDFALATGQEAQPPKTLILKGQSMGKTEVSTARVEKAVRSKRPAKPEDLPTPSSDFGITVPQARILNALKVWKVLGHATPTRQMVSALCGYSAGSGNFSNLLGQLRNDSRIEYPAPGQLQLLIDWHDVDASQAKRIFMNHLSGPEFTILDALSEDDGPWSRKLLGESTGYSHTSGNFSNIIGKLRTLTAVEYPSKGQVQITDWAKQLMRQ